MIGVFLWLSPSLGMLIVVFVCITIASVVIRSVRQWESPIRNTLELDGELEPLESIWTIRGFQLWLRFQIFLAKLRLRRLKSGFLLRLYICHSTIVKGIVALGFSLFAFSKADTSPVLTGATVFYASMLFLKDSFEYAALWSQPVRFTRYKNQNHMDTLSVFVNIRNIGKREAGNIEAKMYVQDPIRKVSGATEPVSTETRDIPESISPNLAEEYQFTFAGLDDKLKNVVNRASMKGKLGDTSFIILEFYSPDQNGEFIVYQSILSAEEKLREEKYEVFESIRDQLMEFQEYTSKSTIFGVGQQEESNEH